MPKCLDFGHHQRSCRRLGGILKADIGVKGGGLIFSIGKAGESLIGGGVDSNLIIVGSNTDVLAGEGKIITAGAIDTHCHSSC